ncbi:MAG TPA: dihydrofolate reductase family protein [Caulobacteraceae bacterium]|jgi:dihydrofolate reductase|nr:dihydrofolate reductase family protein [Caulobacteraceae bacterium]
MARLFFGMNVSLDGYVGGAGGELASEFAPSNELFHHFVEEARGLTGSVYGRRMYEVMRYWDEDDPQWDDERRAYAAAWRGQKKWVASRTLKSVGPNAELIEGDLGAMIRGLKDRVEGQIEVAGPEVAASLTALGLIDEYQLYLRPLVLGAGKPFFAGPTPPLRLTAHEEIAKDAIRLTYVPA